MKKLLVVLMALVLLCLSACGTLVEDSYLVVGKHSEQPTEPTESLSEEDFPTVVRNRSELRGTVLSCIRDWVERDTILVEDYEGSLDDDLSEILLYATQEDPIGAYAVDFVDAELTGDASSGSIALSIVFRRSAAEIDSIITVNDTASALRRIQQALISYETALTLRIRSYLDQDFAEYIRQYCLNNPNLILAIPELSAEVYPQEGETRILELHFTYSDTREDMRLMLSSVNTILGSASSYINSGENDTERLELLARFLSTRFQYKLGESEPSMPAYELLCQGQAHSLSFATVFRYECDKAEIECWMVSGQRGEQAHYWNIVCLEGVYYHVDLMRGIELGERSLTLLSAEELLAEGYAWDMESYPSNPEPEETTAPEIQQPEPTEENQPSETTQESEEPTEETQTEPTEESAQEP